MTIIETTSALSQMKIKKHNFGYVTTYDIWNMGYRSLIMLDSEESENESCERLIESFNHLALKDARNAAVQRKSVGIIGESEDSKTLAMTQESAPDSAGTHTTSKPTNQLKKNSSKSTPKPKRLSTGEVLAIRHLYSSNISQAEIARIMNLPKNTVRYVVRGINYSHVR